MWCYQKPDFEAQLITELQRQQQRRQFCDTLLQTKDVSVPAHSCVLSAISPQISSALSSSPAPPAGQSHLLEFHTLGGCTLLRLAHLIYSGEMVGEGESERQEAISAAAKLGIHGLVEVPRTQVDGHRPGQQVEVGVQTEPPEERRGGASWRREFLDGCNLLLRDAASGSKRDTWTQTEEPKVSVAPPPQPSTSLETIDMTSIQTVHSSLLPEQTPYIPLSVLYAPENLQTYQLSSASVHFLEESTASGHRSASVLTPPHTLLPPLPSLLPPPSQAAQGDISPAEQWDNPNLDEFQGNIPGFIKHFLNPPSETKPCRGRPRGSKCAVGKGAKTAEVSERGTSNTRGRRRGRGGLTQTVDVQDVGVSKLQKLFLQRWSTRLSRTGQGGGAAGRGLCIKSREVLKLAGRGQSKGAQFKMWTFCPNRDGPPYKEEVPGGTNHSRKRTKKPTNQDELHFSQTYKTQPRSAVALPFFTPPAHSHNVFPTSSSSSSLQALLSPRLVSSASSTLSGTPAPAAVPPPGEERHIDHLLEEVMMGLNIMPTNNTTTQTLAANVLQRGGSCGTASSETLVVQQQEEGEINDILDHFLLSFEQHINNSAAREEVGAQSFAEVSEQATQTRQQQDVAEPPANALQPRMTRRTTQAMLRRKSPRKRKRTQRTSSLKSDEASVGDPPSPGVKTTRVFPDLQDKQLQQIAVVKLERRGLLPLQVNLQDSGSLNTKSQITSSPVKQDMNGSSKKRQNVYFPTKSYPIRSKMKEIHWDPEFYLEQPLELHNTCTRQKSRLSQPRHCSKKDSGTRDQQHKEIETQGDTGRKRTAEEAEPLEEATVAKRFYVAGKQQTPVGSPVALTAPPNDEIIDVETVSVSSAGGRITVQVAGDFGLEESEEKDEEEAATSADEIISVGGDCSQTIGDQGSTAGCPDDTEIDVIGGSSPCPTPVTLTWTEPSEEEEEEEEEEKEKEEVAIIEEKKTQYSSSTVIHIFD